MPAGAPHYTAPQTDLRMPGRLLRCLDDRQRMEAAVAAVEAAVAAASQQGERDVRVLLLGSAAGLLALVALRAGAHHVTCVERYVRVCVLKLGLKL